MDIVKRSDIPGLLLEIVPESRAPMENQLGIPVGKALPGEPPFYDLYDFLREVLWCGVMFPGLRQKVPDQDLLRRCFLFVELLITSPVQSISDAGYFQAVEPLFSGEGLIVAAFPLMGPKTLDVARETLDPDWISASAREELAGFLRRPARDTQET
ncbi:hypothetical protein ACWD01_29110 [Streptomyces sp. NPDC002835]